MKNDPKISVVIMTFNADEHLESVLKSVQHFDEVLVCDMYSTDKTIEIAQKYNCKVLYHERMGIPEPARNYAIQSATHDWVFMVDADEYIPETLRNYLYEQIKQDNCPAGIRVPRKNYFLGRFMHSTYPDYVLRFTKKKLTNYPAIIHSQAQVDGEVYTVPKSREDLAFIHLSNESIKSRLVKTARYTDFELERRKNRKYGSFGLIVHPFVRFFRYYIAKGGFRDGRPGLIWAILGAHYKFITIAKVMEYQLTDDDIDKDLKENR